MDALDQTYLCLPPEEIIERARIFIKISQDLGISPYELSEIVLDGVDEFLDAICCPNNTDDLVKTGFISEITGGIKSFIGTITDIAKTVLGAAKPIAFISIVVAPVVSAFAVAYLLSRSKYLDPEQISKYIQYKSDVEEFNRLSKELELSNKKRETAQ